MLETLANGAIVFDRFDRHEQEGRLATEVVFCFLPDNDATPFAVWHRTKEDGGLFWGHYHTAQNVDVAKAYFEDRRAHYNHMKKVMADTEPKTASSV